MTALTATNLKQGTRRATEPKRLGDEARAIRGPRAVLPRPQLHVVKFDVSLDSMKRGETHETVPGRQTAQDPRDGSIYFIHEVTPDRRGHRILVTPPNERYRKGKEEHRSSDREDGWPSEIHADIIS